MSTALFQSGGALITAFQSFSFTIGASSVAPTQGTNTSLAVFRRVGDSAELSYVYSQTGAGTAGTGTYLFPLPSGLVADTTKVLAITGAVGSGGSIVGSGHLATTTAATTSVSEEASIFLFNTTNLYIVANNGTINQQNSVGSAYGSLGATVIYYTFRATVPISGW